MSHRSANALSGVQRASVTRHSVGRGVSVNATDSKTYPKKWIVVHPCASLTDSNGKLLGIPIKLEIEVSKNGGGERERIASLLRSCGEILCGEARKFGIVIFRVEDVLHISEGRRCILTLEVGCAEWQPILTQFVYKFFCSLYELELSVMPTITAHSLSLFPLRLLSDHGASLPLARLQFGSILSDGYCGLHWILTSGRNGREGLYADFDYNGKSIEVEYNCSERPDVDEEKEVEVRGKISIDMKTIQRVYLDQKEERNGSRRISLVLQLATPPKFQVRKVDETFCPWEHRTTLQRGKFPNSVEISHKEALRDSKAIFLELDERFISNRLESSQDSSLDFLLYDVISRLRHKTGCTIEFTSFYQTEMIEGSVRQTSWDEWTGKPVSELVSINPYGVSCDFDEYVRGLISTAAKKLMGSNYARDSKDYSVTWKEFRIRALLQGILDRGMEIRIELLRDKDTWYDFMEAVTSDYSKDEERTLHSLEQVMKTLDEGRLNSSVPDLYNKERSASTASLRAALFSEKDRNEGYFRIMKMVVTPTKTYFGGHEVIMGNRVLNKFAQRSHIIRLIFRDDNGGLMWATNYGTRVQDRIKNVLLDGITYAGHAFEFLGNSNSQLRDQGCYMLHCDSRPHSLTAHDIRVQMGEFMCLPNIPKMMARLGQVFTQSKPSATALSHSEIEIVPDFVGGKKPSETLDFEDGKKPKPYTFSDGVGSISQRHAALLSKEHDLAGTASAFQIRLRGAKGLVCVDPLIDERNEIFEMMGRDADLKVLLRPSMNKFDVISSTQMSDLEVVKYSTSSALFLNRPFINILCQVSEKQSAECHKRIRDRIMGLMHGMLRELFQAFYVEGKAAEVIRETSFPILMEVFTVSCGFEFTTDPFFRCLLLAQARYVIKKQLGKMNIKIPTSVGRSMFGVVDTTGLLQYGQIFCQYSGSISKQGSNASTAGEKRGIILTGRTLVTKNPCISSGDVRMFEAVDIIALRHLVDVIVFPMHGPRPHPDEMAGSDLDGDEYTVIWDEELFLERNEEASEFPSGDETEKWAIPRKENGEVNIKECEELKAEFYTEAIIQGQPGLLCTAHLAVSDLYGLESKPSKSLATKISQTLDYQKTGVKPAEMTKDTVEDPEDSSRVIPAEKIQLKPDFLRNYREPGYASRGILGEVFREASLYDHALDCVEEQKPTIKQDSSFRVEGWEKYKSSAERELASYSCAMKSVFEQYGMETEEELLSGAIISMRNRNSDREEHDGSHFTTNKVVEGTMKRIIEEARERFFENFFDWRTVLDEVESKRSDVKSNSILHRIVKSHTENIEKIRRKASAAYMVAYALRGEQSAILLSFPWIFYDVLMDIKKRPDVKEEATEEIEQSNHPLARTISLCIDSFSRERSNVKNFADFMLQFEHENSIVARSMKENEGLARASFVLLEWANQIGAVSERFGEDYLINLFVLFGLGAIGMPGPKRKFLQKPCGDQRVHLKKGEQLLLFLDFVSSEEFRKMTALSFEEVGGGVLLRGQWRPFSEKALDSFLSLVTTHKLDLPSETGNILVASILREYEPRVMQLPESVVSSKLDEVREALQRISGCKDLKLKRESRTSVTVTAIGTSKQLRALSSFIYPPAPTRDTATLKGMIESLATSTYERIMIAAQKLCTM